MGNYIIPLNMNGTIAMSAARATAGSRPDINPRTTLGRSLIHPKKLDKGAVVVKNLMLDIIPITVAGRDQKTTMAAMNPWIRNRRMILSHQVNLRDDQMISCGRTPTISGTI
jgi:hypothetical protein